MKHDELIILASNWLFNRSHHGKCPVVITDMTSQSRETPDAIGWRNSHSVLVECKASRSDFLADSGKHFRKWPTHAMGTYRYYLTPPGLIDPEELPDGWGLLEARKAGVTVVVVASRQTDTDRAYEIELLASALRRQVCVNPSHGVRVKNYVMDDPSTEPRATIKVSRLEHGDPVPEPDLFDDTRDDVAKSDVDLFG